MDKRRIPVPTFQEIAESAAHLVATIEDPKSGLRRPTTRSEFHDSFLILRTQCKAAGLMQQYPQSPDGKFHLWPLRDGRKIRATGRTKQHD